MLIYFHISNIKKISANKSVRYVKDVIIIIYILYFYFFNKYLTCLSNKSLLADKQVTKYFVKLRNEPKTSRVKCSRDDRCNINDITKKPRFCIMCCCTVCDVSTNSQIKPKSLELKIRQEIKKSITFTFTYL